MASKNKGGREIRKPKADKKAKTAISTSAIPATSRNTGDNPSK